MRHENFKRKIKAANIVCANVEILICDSVKAVCYL